MGEMGVLLKEMINLIESLNNEVRALRSKLLHHELEHEFKNTPDILPPADPADRGSEAP